MTYFRKKILGPLLQDDEIFGGVSSKVKGTKKFFNACSELPTHRHNYCKIIEFANKQFFKTNSPYYTDSTSHAILKFYTLLKSNVETFLKVEAMVKCCLKKTLFCI
jgi:hypothetical protein